MGADVHIASRPKEGQCNLARQPSPKNNTRKPHLAGQAVRGSPSAAEALFAESFDLARLAALKLIAAYALVGLAMVGSGGPTWNGPPGCMARPQALPDLGETHEGRLRNLNCQPTEREQADSLRRILAGSVRHRSAAPTRPQPYLTAVIGRDLSSRVDHVMTSPSGGSPMKRSPGVRAPGHELAPETPICAGEGCRRGPGRRRCALRSSPCSGAYCAATWPSPG